MLRSAARKLGGALPPALGVTQCGRCQTRALLIKRLQNRYTTAAAEKYSDATATPVNDLAAGPSVAPRAVWNSNDTETQRQKATVPRDAVSKATDFDITKMRRTNRGKQRRLLNLSGESCTEMEAMIKVLERKANHEEWDEAVAKSRFVSLPIVLLQTILRQRATQTTQQHERILQLLPGEEEHQKRMKLLATKRHCTQHDIALYANILAANNDDERCKRLLQHQGQIPIHIFLFVLRPASTLADVPTLRNLIGLYRTGSTHEGTRSNISSLLSPLKYPKALSLLATHLIRTEPRLLVDLAEATCAYIQSIVQDSSSGKNYVEHCRLFNSTLHAFQPKAHLLDKQIPVVNAYFWEAQRMLLTLSDTFKRPLQVSAVGFRAIRNTLAGMPKNEAEKHSASLHAPSWPPYLTPGDGMDEVTDPESNWSRTVEAGMLMQEAGFAKSQADDSLDILQGLAPDGTPTIQQRTRAGGFRDISTWEASIRATRDAHEAWGRFISPLNDGAMPGVNEYGAMFEKLTLREATAASKLLPGDKARNFPAHRAANLADIEWAKARPPSVSELYNQMRTDGIIPSGHCLFILVSNAPDLETANRYLSDAAELNPEISNLLSPTINSTTLDGVSMPLFSAYIKVLTRKGHRLGWENLHRAVALAETRLKDKRSRWASLVWGAILKGSSRHHSALRMSPSDQVRLILAIGKRIDRGHRLNLANFAELNRSLRKIIQHDLEALIEQLHNKEIAAGIPSDLPLRVLYDAVFARISNLRDDETATAHDENAAPGNLKSLVNYIKQEFNNFKAKEKSYQASSSDRYIPPLDRMLSRGDVIKSEHALEYMLTMAYAGEFQEMKNLLLWLIEEWGQPDVVHALDSLDDAPPSADFSEVLCIFRLLGEQMLGGPEVAEEMQDAIAESGLPWTWPDVGAVQTYLRTQTHDSIRHVRSVLTQMRAQKKAAAAAQTRASAEESEPVYQNSQAPDNSSRSAGAQKSRDQGLAGDGADTSRRKRWLFQGRQ